jgi:perosamine synthetase
MVRRRKAIAVSYIRALAGAGEDVCVPSVDLRTDHQYFRFVIQMERGTGRFIRRMNGAGIGCARPVFKPLHRYLHHTGFPGTERIFSRAVSLPLYPALTNAEADYIGTTAVKFLSE